MVKPTKPTPAAKKAEEEQLRRVWETPSGWRYWTSVNNTQVGLWYGGAAFAFMLFAGVLALIMRAQLSVPANDLVSADFYNQAFTLHGTVMMFLFAVPIFEAVAIFLLPPMLGTRELPFPRLGAFGFWSFFIGGVFVCGSIFFDAAPSSQTRVNFMRAHPGITGQNIASSASAQRRAYRAGARYPRGRHRLVLSVLYDDDE